LRISQNCKRLSLILAINECHDIRFEHMLRERLIRYFLLLPTERVSKVKNGRTAEIIRKYYRFLIKYHKRVLK